MTEDAPQRSHSLRQVFNGLRWIVRAGAPWRMMPHDLPPWQVVYQQTQRWLGAGVFESLLHDLRELLRVATGRNARPAAAIFDSRTLQSSPRNRVPALLTMGRSGARAARRISPLIRWGICWRSSSRRPMSKTGRK
jgi:transposase